MKVVVTGATGHLGSYVVTELAHRGHDVIAASRSGRLPSAPFGVTSSTSSARGLVLDLCEENAVARLASELGPEVGLVHLAAWHPPSTANTSALDRTRLLETNVLGTQRALEAARRGAPGVAAVVYASTFEVYGELDPGNHELLESSRTVPRTDYGATKLSGEDHLLAFAYEERTRVVALRFSAIYGPGETTSRALPNFLRSIARRERPVIHGDGADLRDQVHARDAAIACALALESSAQGIFNLADGAPHSIMELAQTACDVAGGDLQPELRAREKNRRDYHMDIGKARSELGFSPSIDLRAGMAEQLAWLRAGT